MFYCNINLFQTICICAVFNEFIITTGRSNFLKHVSQKVNKTNFKFYGLSLYAGTLVLFFNSFMREISFM